jgi:hypothetical protein
MTWWRITVWLNENDDRFFVAVLVLYLLGQCVVAT